jgi:hypothetical protein
MGAGSSVASSAVTGLTTAANDASTVGGGVITVVLAVVGVAIIVKMLNKA